MATKPKTAFASEAELCAAFISDVDRDYGGRWKAYAETEGWDILLVHRDGTQVGIQAKMALNAKVIEQALPSLYNVGSIGPDFRAILVPANETGKHLSAICNHIGFTIIRQREHDSRYVRWVNLPDAGYNTDSWQHWYPLRRHELPDYIPDVTAGSASPTTLSRWKVSAIKLAIVLEHRPVTRADIKALGISPSRWLDKHTGYLTATPSGYVASGYMPDFKRAHPVNYEQIKADIGKWMPSLSSETLV